MRVAARQLGGVPRATTRRNLRRPRARRRRRIIFILSAGAAMDLSICNA